MADKARQQEQAKVLRIGVVQGGKVVDERLISSGESVSVGESSRNTFVAPAPSLPKRFVLFQARGTQYTLNFTEKMKGRISHNDAVVGLDDLRSSGAATRKGTTWSMSITDKNRGKVVIDDTTVLFQFVPAPLESARMLSHKDFRPKLIEEDDPVFLAFLATFSLMAAVLMIYVFNTEPPELASIDDIPDRFVELIIPPPNDDDKPDDETLQIEDDDAQKVDKVEEEKPAEPEEKKPKRELTPEEKAAQEAARKQKMQEEVLKQSKLLVGILGTRGESSSGDTVVDIFADSDSVGANLKDALQSVGGVEIADGTNMGVKSGTAGGREDASIGDLAKSGGGQAGVGSGPTTKVKAKSDLGSIEAVGGEADQVKATVAKYSGQVKYCYEQRLKEVPSLSGRVLVAINISGGRVTSASIDENTTGDKGLESCVVSKVRAWRFDAEVTMDIYLPFALSAGG